MSGIIFVSESTCTTGKEVVRQLLERGVSVRAGVHSKEKADKMRTLGTEPVLMGLSEVGSIEAVLEGVEGAFSMSPFVPDLGVLGINFVRAAKNNAGIIGHRQGRICIHGYTHGTTDNGKGSGILPTIRRRSQGVFRLGRADVKRWHLEVTGVGGTVPGGRPPSETTL